MSAIGANTIKRDLGAKDLVTRGFFQPSYGRSIKLEISIHDFVALHTNQVGMRLESFAIIMGIVSQVDLQYLVHFLQQCQGFVHSGRTHSRELRLDSCVKLAGAGMSFAGGNQPDQLDTLGCQPEIALLQSRNQFVKPGFWISHRWNMDNYSLSRMIIHYYNPLDEEKQGRREEMDTPGAHCSQ